MKINDILRKNGFRFDKKYGQNFLTDENLLAEIVDAAGIDQSDTVVEIGCGAGTLTKAISEKAGRVVGFEIDKSLGPVLSETLSGVENAEIIFRDVMKVKDDEIRELVKGRFSLVANLPYYITTPIIMRFIEDFPETDKIVVTVQEEVADRFCAEAGTPDYGAITAGINAVGNAEKIMRIGREKFFPSPNVDSAVVKITLRRDKYAISDMKAYREVVKCAFSNRRKTLANNLINTFGITRAEAEECIRAAGGDIMDRGETFSAEDFIKLTDILTDLI